MLRWDACGIINDVLLLIHCERAQYIHEILDEPNISANGSTTCIVTTPILVLRRARTYPLHSREVPHPCVKD